MSTVRPPSAHTGRRATRARILDAATDLFGLRGVDAVSLDLIASEVGVTKQTLLYWFPSKDELLAAVLLATATELVDLVEAALRASTDDPLDRVDAVVRAVFRPAVRRPALLGLVREVNRLPVPVAARLTEQLEHLASRAAHYLRAEMDAGRLRRADPGLVAALCYATVTGVATEPAVLRINGWEQNTAGLRHLRDELRAFLRAALRP